VHTSIHETKTSEHNNVLSNAVSSSPPSQATAGGSPASAGWAEQRHNATAPTYSWRARSPAHPLFLPWPSNWAEEDRIDELVNNFSRTFGPLDHYSRLSTLGPGHHHATAWPNKYDVIIRRALTDKVHAEGLLARDVEKRTDAHASIQAILGLLQDGIVNTMSALRHCEQNRNEGIRFGSNVSPPLSAQPSGNFPSQDNVRYMYQMPNNSQVHFRRQHQMVIRGGLKCQCHA